MTTYTPVLPQPAQSPGAASKKKSLWRQIVDNRWVYLFVTPWLILTIVFGWYPMPASIQIAFYKWKGFGELTTFVGLAHFENILKDKFFWQAVKNAIHYTVALVPVQLSLSLLLALVLNNPKLRLAGLFRAGFFIPVVCSVVVLGVPFKIMVRNAIELVPQLLVDAGWIRPSLGFLMDPRWAMWVIIIFGIWQTFGYNLVFFLAALQSVPQEIYEAATVDGAGWFTKTWYITLPMIRPMAVIIVLMALLGSMRVFDGVMALTDGGPMFATEVPQTYIYHHSFTPPQGSTFRPDLGYASAASIIYSLILLVLTVAQVLLVARAKTARREMGLG
jgi:ABC-type sugar transport system permease subunit